MSENKVVHFQRDTRNKARTKLTSKSTAVLYGNRPLGRADLKYLSPYEFTMYWEPELVKYPQTRAQNDSDDCEAKLTPTGIQRLEAEPGCELMAGIDYVVKEEGGNDWVPLEDVAGTKSLRHEWMLRKRPRPRAPHFKGCPLPKHRSGSSEQNAKITMTYFHPWTLRDEMWGDEHVPTVYNLKGKHENWQTALATWLDGQILCEESRRYVSNFIAMHRLRPGDIDDNGAPNSDDMIADEPVYVTREIGKCNCNDLKQKVISFKIYISR